MSEFKETHKSIVCIKYDISMGLKPVEAFETIRLNAFDELCLWFINNKQLRWMLFLSIFLPRRFLIKVKIIISVV